MAEKKFYRRLTVLFTLSVCLMAVSITSVLLARYAKQVQFKQMGTFCGKLIEAQPDAEQAVWKALKESENIDESENKNILLSFGYRAEDLKYDNSKVFLYSFLGFAGGGILFLLSFWYWHRRTSLRIRQLTDYLEKINTGHQGLILDVAEDDFSRLQDEIYKTVTVLHQTREAAVEAKNNFADNLSNIAHQLKTPITAISLSTQMMKLHPSPEYPVKIQRQLNRLTYLEESLLVLSRIDAGALVLNQSSVDVFTLLTLAADNLQELSVHKKVFIDIPEMDEVKMNADLEWTMEAIMNLFKNCMEHSPEGAAVHCSCDTNPLYVQILIWDEGEGFHKEDLPHLFERFYCGENANDGSTGIGLSLAKEIIEMQNGILRAGNLPSGGACFDLRFYSH